MKEGSEKGMLGSPATEQGLSLFERVATCEIPALDTSVVLNLLFPTSHQASALPPLRRVSPALLAHNPQAIVF